MKRQWKRKLKMRVKQPKPAHKIELRKREISDSYCAQPGCKFQGKPAAQGICHTVLDKSRSAYIKTVIREGQDCLDGVKALRKANKQLSAKAWISALEGYFVCHWANGQFTLDELIYLRAENAQLRLKVNKWGNKGRRTKV